MNKTKTLKILTSTVIGSALATVSVLPFVSTTNDNNNVATNNNERNKSTESTVYHFSSWEIDLSDDENPILRSISVVGGVSKTMVLDVSLGGASNKDITILNIDDSVSEDFLFEIDFITLSTDYSVVSFGEHAFYQSKGLTSITVPDTATSIGNRSFSWCENLKTVVLGSGLASIGDTAFNFSALENISFSSSNSNFSMATNLGADAKVVIEGSNSTWDGNYNTLAGDLVCGDVVLPSTVTAIGDNAFSGCGGLTSISIPNTVTLVENYAFWGCNKLKNIDGVYYSETGNVPNSVQWALSYDSNHTSSNNALNVDSNTVNIANQAFIDCKWANEVNIPNSVKSIGSNAFVGCEISDINLEEGNTAYGYATNIDEADIVVATNSDGDNLLMDGCTNIVGCLASGVLNFSDSAYTFTSIGNNAFKGCSGVTRVIISADITSIGTNAFSNCTSIESISIDSLNTNFVLASNVGDANVVLNASSGGLLENGCDGIIGNLAIGNLNLPDTFNSIANNAFNGCASITSVNLSNIESIGSYAFGNCFDLVDLSIPSTCTTISNNAFDNCVSMASVTWWINSESSYNVGGSAFSNSDESLNIYTNNVEILENFGLSNVETTNQISVIANNKKDKITRGVAADIANMQINGPQTIGLKYSIQATYNSTNLDSAISSDSISAFTINPETGVLHYDGSELDGSVNIVVSATEGTDKPITIYSDNIYFEYDNTNLNIAAIVGGVVGGVVGLALITLIIALSVNYSKKRKKIQ